ncbi:phosphate ABC transporter permease subunit PstC [Microbulbifer thermotolerans]|nr:phosphate ABC transporter permease subunit PstC [Microbulbifer thermotolerans]
MSWIAMGIVNRTDHRLSMMLAVLSAGAALLLTLIVLFLIKESWPFLSSRWHSGSWFDWLQYQGWYPQENRFGMAPMLLASLAVTLGALIVALPVGLASAIYLQFYANPKVARTFRLLLTLLAGVPSVVFGLWGLTRIVPLIALWQPSGASLLAAILVLSLMVLPTIALTSAAALASVSRELLHGGIALGMRRKTQILHIMLPAARSNIFGGVLLATARALGETMAVLMVAGNVVQFPAGLFDPVRVLTANIALEMSYAMGDHRASLFASGLLLTAMVWLLSWGSYRVTRNGREAGQYG